LGCVKKLREARVVASQHRDPLARVSHLCEAVQRDPATWPSRVRSGLGASLRSRGEIKGRSAQGGILRWQY
jgi:hypothetical protein